jgi:hypothetical protein
LCEGRAVIDAGGRVDRQATGKNRRVDFGTQVNVMGESRAPLGLRQSCRKEKGRIRLFFSQIRACLWSRRC